MFREKMPRVEIAGLTDFNRAWARLADAIEYLLKLDGEGAVRVDHTGTGPIVGVAPTTSGFDQAKVTTAVTAGSGTGSSYGAGVVSVLLGTTGTTGRTNVAVKNYHEHGFALNAVVGVARGSDGTYWVIDVGRCADYA